MRTAGAVKVGGVDVRQMDPHVLMDQVAFVFQNSRLFKSQHSGKCPGRPPGRHPGAGAGGRLTAAQCGDILEKLPQGMDTRDRLRGDLPLRRRGSSASPWPGPF